MSDAPDPGLEAAVPFAFDCHRCGNCCTAGAGYVWLEEEELERLARRLEMQPAAFRERMTRSVLDPGSGRMRLSLRERETGSNASGGRCILLEGRSECSVYEDRPRHCADFPYWPSVMGGGAGFESARSTCPGISPLVDAATRTAAFAELEALYAEVDREVAALSPRCEMSGLCCRFEEAGHQLWATSLEADYALALHPELAEPEKPGRCPYHVGGICRAREGRALGCRTYFCDERTEAELESRHEDWLRRLRAIERRLGYPAAYGPFPAFLEARQGLPLAPAAPPEGAGAADPLPDSGKSSGPGS